MKMNNYTIYKTAQELVAVLENIKSYIPAKANFFMQKNINIITEAAQEIENSRIEIAKHYGELSENGEQYIIPTERLTEANKEIEELFGIEQELNIKTFSIEAFGNVDFTPSQMRAIMFMIED